MSPTLRETSRTSLRENELKLELASKVARLIGQAQKQATAIPRVTLHQRTAPTPACHATYEPSVMMVAQGRKEVQIGTDTLTYDSSRYLLTSVDLPTVTRVAEASEAAPCLAISIIRDFLSREDFPLLATSPASPAMSTGPVTIELLNAWCRLLDLLSTP